MVLEIYPLTRLSRFFSKTRNSRHSGRTGSSPDL